MDFGIPGTQVARACANAAKRTQQNVQHFAALNISLTQA
ncbi:hypothetical protein AZ54_02600 [Xanthomonas oryzae pv. oryzae PXO86]|uniref:Uncharacterized protein n=1 Tax=Xanthomonas oryzae pv. oryzae (strain PXO99A) TaxID=360094 RepID=A0A0K0GGD8_XANOP|nr:hypothetical protein PXO_03687 [Xanthomonas oryzae pv. oryzae PXO99A]AJQ85374.1 hypothetical protein AZ54_02600 [Xanthomonas oryzae pv. oryzae PXO86]